MHELSVCLALLEEVKRVAAENNASGVARIVVKVGPLSGVEADLLRNAYPLAAAGTLAEDAELEIEPAGIVVRCSECGAETKAKANRLLCGACGDYRTNLVSGDEMILTRVEMSSDVGNRDRVSGPGSADSD
jgi:hydrogenase nickel incorporation protein HypA/HybF